MKFCENTGKAQYKSSGAAMKAAHNVTRKYGKRDKTKICAFKCDHCQYFHWGHSINA